MIFIDMDGTLAKIFDRPNYLEQMYEKGFFLNLKPYKWVKQLNKFCKDRNDVYILSACVDTEFCEKEKRAWLKTYLPNIPLANHIFTKVGENKAEKVEEMFSKEMGYRILVDDYGVNLYDWQMQGFHYIGVKFLNGINDKKGKHYAYKIDGFVDFVSLIHEIDTRE